MQNPPVIDRTEVVNLFQSLLDPVAAPRFLRLLGEAKMGKTYLLTHVLPAVAHGAGATCAVADLRNASQGPAEHLLLLTQQIDAVHFEHFERAQVAWQERVQIKVTGFQALFAVVSMRAQGGEQGTEALAAQLTRAFVEDLRQHTGSRFMLIFDAVEQALPATQSWLMDNLLVQLSSLVHVCVVMGGRTLPAAAGGYAPHCCSYELKSVRESEPYVQYCRAISAQLPEEHIPTLAKAFDFTPGAFAEAVRGAFLA